jgi:hypothetical protein
MNTGLSFLNTVSYFALHAARLPSEASAISRDEYRHGEEKLLF